QGQAISPAPQPYVNANGPHRAPSAVAPRRFHLGAAPPPFSFIANPIPVLRTHRPLTGAGIYSAPDLPANSMLFATRQTDIHDRFQYGKAECGSIWQSLNQSAQQTNSHVVRSADILQNNKPVTNGASPTAEPKTGLRRARIVVAGSKTGGDFPSHHGTRKAGPEQSFRSATQQFVSLCVVQIQIKSVNKETEGERFEKKQRAQNKYPWLSIQTLGLSLSLDTIGIVLAAHGFEGRAGREGKKSCSPGGRLRYG
ncbi:hypothetical protein L249_8390, partial [Ophiocordyceps polyrhachis-furcata BCC 54312]